MTAPETPNMCDGCQRRLPLVNGIHHCESIHDLIGCTAHLYGHLPTHARRPLPTDGMASPHREVPEIERAQPHRHRYGGPL